MKIKAILEQKPTVSFEVFPPKQWDKIEGTKAVVKEMVKSHPAFMSVTYGAAGTTSGFTTEIAREILDDGVTPLAHLTCLTSTRDKIHQVVAELQENGIENILALRGDIPRDFQFPAEQYFEHAYQLVNEIRTLGDFCIGGACYPEVHPESKNRVEDLEHLKQKVDCGVDFLTTQMFFDNTVFYNFREMCAIKGIDVPLIAGIMPITKASQLERTVKLSGCSAHQVCKDRGALRRSGRRHAAGGHCVRCRADYRPDGQRRGSYSYLHHEQAGCGRCHCARVGQHYS